MFNFRTERIRKQNAESRKNLPRTIYSVNEQREESISKTFFFTGSLGVFSLGMMIGIQRIMKKEGHNLPPENRSAAAGLAAKALGVGTLLCLGAFAAGSAIFVGVTGITTVEQFGEFARKMVHGTGLPKTTEGRSQEEEEESKKAEQELEKILNDFFSPKKEEEKNKPESSDTIKRGSNDSFDFKSLIHDFRKKLREKFKKKDE